MALTNFSFVVKICFSTLDALLRTYFQVDIPIEFTGKTYGDLFKYLVEEELVSGGRLSVHAKSLARSTTTYYALLTMLLLLLLFTVWCH